MANQTETLWQAWRESVARLGEAQIRVWRSYLDTTEELLQQRPGAAEVGKAYVRLVRAEGPRYARELVDVGRRYATEMGDLSRSSADRLRTEVKKAGAETRSAGRASTRTRAETRARTTASTAKRATATAKSVRRSAAGSARGSRTPPA